MDVITYSADTAALIAEFEQVAPYYVATDDNGDKQLTLIKTPTLRSSNETLAVVRNLPLAARSMTHLTVIGQIAWDADQSPYRVMGFGALSAADAGVIYDRVYPRTPITSPEGDYTPPDLFAAFPYDDDSARKAGIKAAAREHICSRLPGWKQSNYLARHAELEKVLLAGGSHTPAEQSEWDALQVEWDWVKAVRAASDQAELDGICAEEVVWP